MSAVEVESTAIADTSGDARTDFVAVAQDEKENGTIEGEYNQNIMNAYLIMKYHVLINEDSDEKRSIILMLVVMYYATSAIQTISYILLIIVYVGSGDYPLQSKHTWVIWHFEFPNNEQWIAFCMFPLYIIGIVGLCGEVQIAWQDWKLFAHHAAANADGAKVRIPFEIIMAKTGEIVSLGCAALVYIYFLARYPSGTGWGSVLDTIFNLLAYQFVTQMDESVYPLIETNMRIWCKHRGVAVDDIFAGQMAYEKPSNVFPRLAWIGATSLFFTGLQAQAKYTTFTAIGLIVIISLYRLKELWQKQKDILTRK